MDRNVDNSVNLFMEIFEISLRTAFIRIIFTTVFGMILRQIALRSKERQSHAVVKA